MNRILLVLLLGISVSCVPGEGFSEQIDFKGESWPTDRSAVFNLTVEDTISRNDVFINIRNNNDYPFSNIFLISAIDFPAGNRVIDTLEYEMADKRGNWLGSGITDLKESKLFLKKGVVFPDKGSYRIEIRQAVRNLGDTQPLENLPGIVGVGVSVESLK